MTDRPQPAAAGADHLPRVNPDFLHRPRLIALLDRWSPVTVVLAPSGAGKAVLAGQWAAHAHADGNDVVWLDGEVDDPDAAVATLAGVGGLDVDADRGAVLRRLRRAFQRRGTRLAIVVNNAEPLLDALGPELVDIVRDCRRVHLVACLRRRLDPVAKALLEAETLVVGAADLELTTEEVQALAARHGLELAPFAAEEIRESVGGWAALVRTGLERLVTREGRPSTYWSPRHVAWFLDVNLIPALPPSAWAALQRSALVEQPVLGAVTTATGELDEAARTALEAIGVLDPLVTAGDPIFRLPPVMRDHFRARYDAAELGPAEAVHDAVVRWWLDQDEPAPALRQAVAGGRWSVSVEIADRHCWALLSSAPDALRESLTALPAPVLRTRPRVELVHQVLDPRDPTPESTALRERIEDVLAASASAAEIGALDPADAVEALDLLTLLVARERGRGSWDRARELAARAEPVAARLRSTTAPASPVVRRWALQTGTVRLLTGDPGAEHALRGAVAGPGGPDPLTGDAAGGLALLASLHGDRATTRQWLDVWRGARPEAATPPGYVDLAARLAAAAESLHALDRDDAVLLELEQQLPPDHELTPLVLWVRARHAVAWGGRSRVLTRLRAARTAAGATATQPWPTTLLTVAKAEVALSQGRTATAARLLDDVDLTGAPVAIARARLARMVGRAEEALRLVEPVLAPGHPDTESRIEAIVLAAWCHDDTRSARAALTTAAEQARAARLALPFSRVPRDLLVAHARAVPDLAEVLTILEEAEIRASYAVGEELPVLTPREQAVLAQLPGTRSLDGIAGDLFVSRNTVKTQTSSLYRKLGVGDRWSAVRRAYQLGLLE